MAASPTPPTVPWLKLFASVVLLFALFHFTADALGSLRGEAGLLVGGLVVAATLLTRRFGWREAWRDAALAVGLGRPTRRSLGVVLAVAGLLLAVVPVFVIATESPFNFFPGWWALLPGLFAQGGLAEEVLFRGYLFGTLRRRHSFWRAAALSSGPFLLAHLLMFAFMPWPVALASCALALVVSFPLAHLFELGGRTVWAPAILHFVIQSALKVVVVSGPQAGSLPPVWIAACGLLSWLVFLVRPPGEREDRPTPPSPASS